MEIVWRKSDVIKVLSLWLISGFQKRLNKYELEQILQWIPQYYDIKNIKTLKILKPNGLFQP